MSIRAPSPSSSRSASSIVYWTTAPGSRAPEIRVPSSRSERSMEARRSIDSRERASSSISRALAIASAAWSDSARTSAIWGAVKASTAFENVPSAPNTSSPARQRRDDHRADADLVDERVGRVGVDEPLVGRVVAGDDDPPVGDRLAEHPDPDRELERPHPVVRSQLGDPRRVHEPEHPALWIEEVQERAVGAEQPGGLLGRALEERRDVAAERHAREPRDVGSRGFGFGRRGGRSCLGAGASGRHDAVESNRAVPIGSTSSVVRVRGRMTTPPWAGGDARMASFVDPDRRSTSGARGGCRPYGASIAGDTPPARHSQTVARHQRHHVTPGGFP